MVCATVCDITGLMYDIGLYARVCVLIHSEDNNNHATFQPDSNGWQ